MNLSLIKPKYKNKSDKYSANLYKYLLKYPNSRVYMSENSLINENKLIYGEGNLELYSTFIGQDFDDFLHGNKLLEVIQSPTRRNWAFIKKELNLIDITDSFFDDYTSIGVCLWDKNHLKFTRNIEDRYTYFNDNERICNYCGHQQTKYIEKVVKEYEFWE